MKHWFRDTHFRSLLKNSSYLAASAGWRRSAGIATIAFAGRGLGLVMFGTLILITSYTQAASGLSKFQSWQLIIRYGAPALVAGEPQTFKQSTGFAFALDVVSGLVGMVAALALLPLLGPWFGIPRDYMWLAMVYCLLLPTMAAATPDGRVAGARPVRPDQLARHGQSDRSCRLGDHRMVARAGPFPWFVAIWFVTDLGGDLYLWFLAWRELRRRDLLKGIRPTLKPHDAARCLEIRGNGQFDRLADAGVGPDRAADRRRPARAG